MNRINSFFFVKPVLSLTTEMKYMEKKLNDLDPAST